MEPVDRMLRARAAAEQLIHAALSEIDPEVAETAIGRALVGDVLVEKAYELLEVELDPEQVRSVLHGLVDRAGPEQREP
jgi:hypothetical protein